eukprot:1194510-Prorocentrum_minimum.AAC.10
MERGESTHSSRVRARSGRCITATTLSSGACDSPTGGEDSPTGGEDSPMASSGAVYCVSLVRRTTVGVTGRCACLDRGRPPPSLSVTLGRATCPASGWPRPPAPPPRRRPRRPPGGGGWCTRGQSAPPPPPAGPPRSSPCARGTPPGARRCQTPRLREAGKPLVALGIPYGSPVTSSHHRAHRDPARRRAVSRMCECVRSSRVRVTEGEQAG